MKTRKEKAAEIDLLKDRFSRACAVVLSDYKGLKVDEMAALRAALREVSCEYRVV
ncbi:MAG: 50S ribosomal protein L10, partial [Nitrospirae bacterium]